jgi:hypothetical protein
MSDIITDADPTQIFQIVDKLGFVAGHSSL